MSICFILLTMLSGNNPVYINTDKIVEFYPSNDKRFTLLSTLETSTRVLETPKEVFEQIKKECK